MTGARAGAGQLHGLHVHEIATEDYNCNQAGSHYNPTGSHHGGRNGDTRHVGDFGNVAVGDSENIQTTFVDRVASLDGPHSIVNRTLVVQSSESMLSSTN